MRFQPHDPQQCWKLPPLILSPFAGPLGPRKLLEGSRAGLILQGLLRDEQSKPEDLEQKLMEGRYCELAMLFYLGKDLERWSEQCLDFSRHQPELRDQRLREQSFTTLLIEDTPPGVMDKLHIWGVQEYRNIFSRALGLQAAFASLPEADALKASFVLHLHRYADYLYACRQQVEPFTQIARANFDFELFASGEYSLLLEREWGPN